jgi:hypothetical protein
MSFIFPSVCLRPTCPIFWNFGSYKSDKKVANLHLQYVNLVVVPHLGSIDSRITHALALWASSTSRRSRGLHSRRGHARRARRLANLVATWSAGSIDSLAPAPSPFGLCPCCSLPSGSIPAGDILQWPT